MERSDGRPGQRPPALTIAIVTWNSRDDIQRCLRALGALPDDWEAWIVDNASTDGTAEVVATHFPHVRLLANRENLGFARANNQVLAATTSPYALLLNPDTEVSPAVIATAVREMQAHPGTGIVGVRLLNTNGSLQPSCFRFPAPVVGLVEAFGLYRLLSRPRRARWLLGVHWAHDEPRAVDWVIGAFMLVQRNALRRVGMLPEESFMFGEDIEWCHRMWKHGYQVRFIPAGAAVHHGGRSVGQHPPDWRQTRTCRAKYGFCRRNYGVLATVLVQFGDIVGCTLRRWRYARRPGDRAMWERMVIGQRSAWRGAREMWLRSGRA